MLTQEDLLRRLQDTDWRSAGGYFGGDHDSPCALMQIAGFRCARDAYPYSAKFLTAFEKKMQFDITSFGTGSNFMLVREIMHVYDNCKNAADWEQAKLSFLSRIVEVEPELTSEETV